MVFKTCIPSERNTTRLRSLFIIDEMNDELKISPCDNLFLLSSKILSYEVFVVLEDVTLDKIPGLHAELASPKT
jgi:hypothetical protein